MSALTSEDGAFSIVPAAAVELAYMLSTAEAYVNEMEETGETRPDGRKIMQLKNPFARSEVAELIADYLEGRLSPAEVRAEILTP